MNITVAIVEDNHQLREELRNLINGGPDFSCVATFPDAHAALAGIPKIKPNVVLMDINLPDISGIECVRRLREQCPGLRIVMLTVYDEVGQLFDSLKAGACGYLLKRSAPDILLQSITEAHLGGAPMTRKIARKFVEYFNDIGKFSPESPPLSKRERETLALLAEGFRYKEIAVKMNLSFHTVREYVRSVYEKLHVTSRTEAAIKYKEQKGFSPRG
jgi:DNA-binding NarL/FixJ family response regulator